METIYVPPPITGYRNLTEADKQLANRIKAVGDEHLRPLLDELRRMQDQMIYVDPAQPERGVMQRVDAELLAEARSHLRLGIMLAVRAVLQPGNF